MFYGDNLDILKRKIPDESIDLIYLDPPFNSKADYNILFKEASGEQSVAQIRAFSDFWHWDSAARKTYEYLVGNEVDNRVATLAESMNRLLGKNDMTAYLFMMTIRLIEMRRVLKSTGSIYLHCDPTASHYLKLVMDSVFGVGNFRNEVIWKRTYAHGSADKWGDVHDTLLFYTKTNEYTWTGLPQRHTKDYLDDKYHFKDKRGRYTEVVITGPGTTSGDSGKEWGGYNPTQAGRHWAVPQSALSELRSEGVTVPKNLREQLDLLLEHGYIRIPEKKDGSKGVPRFKFYLKGEGSPVQDLILDIPPINSQAQERLGYPTQKPVALLERIIGASSRKGDWVLDPFCGCGTAIDAAEKMNRHWVGIDVTYLAVNIIKSRMHDSYPRAKFRIEGEPQELEAAKELAKDRYQFQWWALSLVGARPVGSSNDGREGKKGADEGIDGWLRFGDGNGRIERIVVQVKSGHVGVKDIRELRDVVSRQRAAMGIFITLEEPTSEMVKEVKATEPFKHPTWQHEYPRLQIMTIDRLLKGEMPDIPPTISPFQEAPISKRASEGKAGTLI